MRTTLVAVFQNVELADQAARAVRERGLADEVTVLSRRTDGPEQGQPPIITGPGYGVGQAGQGEPGDNEPMGGGTSVGATIGATMGLLASTYAVPGIGVAVSEVGPVLTTLMGAGMGALVGGLVERGSAEQPSGLANNERDADNYAGLVRLGGALLVAVCPGARAEECKAALEARGPLELRVHRGGPVGEEENLKPAQSNDWGKEPGPVGTSPWPGHVLHGHQALNAGWQKQTGRQGPMRGPGAEPGAAAPDSPTRPGEAQPGPGGGASMGD